MGHKVESGEGRAVSRGFQHPNLPTYPPPPPGGLNGTE